MLENEISHANSKATEQQPVYEIMGEGDKKITIKSRWQPFGLSDVLSVGGTFTAADQEN